ncbi:MAG TPA: adenylate/guanylate cyclase domain-containing protein [Candidatus Limnocylindrales bacterium]|nr:adenylate/guanylate cyclase domain-containing protein [Candidatus Limnocylindrales bacterium]
MSVEARTFDAADDVVTFDHGRVELVKVGSITVGRETLEPGWRWSEHVRPIVRTEWCEFAHVMYVLSGRARVVTRDGETRDIGPGEVVAIDPGHDAWVLGDESVVSIDIQGVVGWARPPDPGERVLTTILFTDIVESTVVAERMGDQAWKRLLASHEEDILALLAQHRGRLVKTTGDGFVGTFEAPARAVRCALDLADAAQRLGVAIRGGIHTGEVEFADDDIRGIAVHVAARVMAAAEPGTVYVSATTRELTIGAGLEFADRGTRALKGITGERQLFEARRAGSTP